MMNLLAKGMQPEGQGAGQAQAPPSMPEGLQMPSEEETKKMFEEMMKVMEADGQPEQPGPSMAPP